MSWSIVTDNQVEWVDYWSLLQFVFHCLLVGHLDHVGQVLANILYFLETKVTSTLVWHVNLGVFFSLRTLHMWVIKCCFKVGVWLLWRSPCDGMIALRHLFWLSQLTNCHHPTLKSSWASISNKVLYFLRHNRWLGHLVWQMVLRFLVLSTLYTHGSSKNVLKLVFGWCGGPMCWYIYFVAFTLTKLIITIHCIGRIRQVFV